jgi:hypothetical protein
MRYDPIVFIFARFLLIGLALGFPSYFIFRRMQVNPAWIRLRHRFLTHRKTTTFLKRYDPDQP